MAFCFCSCSLLLALIAVGYSANANGGAEVDSRLRLLSERDIHSFEFLHDNITDKAALQDHIILALVYLESSRTLKNSVPADVEPKLAGWIKELTRFQSKAAALSDDKGVGNAISDWRSLVTSIYNGGLAKLIAARLANDANELKTNAQLLTERVANETDQTVIEQLNANATRLETDAKELLERANKIAMEAKRSATEEGHRHGDDVNDVLTHTNRTSYKANRAVSVVVAYSITVWLTLVTIILLL